MERLVFNTAEHKLEELEKYGFKKYFGYAKNYNKSLTCSIDIDFENCIIINIRNNDYKKYDLLNDLYDLIKDGLVVKEKKDE